MRSPVAVLTLLALLAAGPSYSQSQPPAAGRVIRLSGSLVLSNHAGSPEPVRFAIYDAEAGGVLLWEETQALALDADGHYSVLLGSASPGGLPAVVFAADASRWLAVERVGLPAGPRTLITAVPYAIAAGSAADASSLGGRPATDYVLTAEARRRDGERGDDSEAAAARTPAPLVNNGTTGFFGKFFNSQDLDSSSLFQGTGARVGLGTTTPLDMFHSAFTNTTGTVTGYAVQNLGSTSTSYSGMLFYDHAGTLRQFQGYSNGTGEYRINNISPTGAINFLIGSTSRFRVATTGRIGLGAGANEPATKLHLFGASYPDRVVRATAFTGSIDAPTATFGSTLLLSLEGAGHDGTAFTSERAYIDLRTAQEWSAGAHGTAIVFATTANDTAAPTERVTIAQNGYVGIGTLAPAVPLDVSGNTTLGNADTFSMFVGGSTALATSSGALADVSIRANGWVVGAGIAAISDGRIKNVAGRSDGARDLDVLNRVEITDYTFKDSVEKGTTPHKKVVAQQVEQVFPQAVSRTTDVVPDIFRPARLAGGWISLATTLQVGERVRLITASGRRAVHDVVDVAPGRFKTDLTDGEGDVFVYGREVRDFRVVDYDAIAMLNVSATQELHRRLEQQSAALAVLTQDVATLRAALATAHEALQAARR